MTKGGFKKYLMNCSLNFLSCTSTPCQEAVIEPLCTTISSVPDLPKNYLDHRYTGISESLAFHLPVGLQISGSADIRQNAAACLNWFKKGEHITRKYLSSNIPLSLLFTYFAKLAELFMYCLQTLAFSCVKYVSGH